MNQPVQTMQQVPNPMGTTEDIQVQIGLDTLVQLKAQANQGAQAQQQIEELQALVGQMESFINAQFQQVEGDVDRFFRGGRNMISAEMLHDTYERRLVQTFPELEAIRQARDAISSMPAAAHPELSEMSKSTLRYRGLIAPRGTVSQIHPAVVNRAPEAKKAPAPAHTGHPHLAGSPLKDWRG